MIFMLMAYILYFSLFFFFNDTATTEIYTLSLHDALPISPPTRFYECAGPESICVRNAIGQRSEEHTSELQSRLHLVCRLLLEKKKKKDHFLSHIAGLIRSHALSHYDTLRFSSTLLQQCTS